MPLCTVGKHDLYYEVHGSGSGEPAVLLMGLGSDLHGWERQVPELARTRRVLVMDNRGVGRSAKPDGPYSTAELGDDVVGVMDAAGIPRAHMVGLSLGGMIAQQVALRHARRVRSLALLATYARLDRRTPAGAGTASGGLGLAGLLGAGSSLDMRAAFVFLAPLVFSAEFLMREKDFLRAQWERSRSYGLSPEGFLGQLAAAMSHDVLGELATLGAPTLIVTGTADRLIEPRHSQILCHAVPGSRLVEIEGGTHAINLERAEELNAILSSWLRAADPT
jgi:pimeloyl-ACP methyl ester carboxylesterase